MPASFESESTTDPGVESMHDYVAALRLLRTVRTVLFTILLLCLLCPLATFGLRCAGHFDARQALPDGEPVVPEARLNEFVPAALRVAEVFARAVVVLLLVVYLLAVNVCLIGRLGSGRDAMAGLFWMTLLLALLGCGAQWLGPQAPRVFYGLDALRSADANLRQEPWLLAVHYTTFGGLPLLAALAAVVADMRFGRSYGLAMQRVRERLGIATHHGTGR